MERNINDRMQKRHDNRVLAGVILLVVGVIYLFNQFDFFFVPGWVFSWPMALILIGLASGYKRNFRSAGWLFMVVIGGVFLANMIVPGVQVFILWPLIMISVGIRMMFFREHRWCRERWEQRHEWKSDPYKPEPTSL